LSTPPKRDGNKALKEFLSEAQELVETLSRNLLDIDAALKNGEPDPDMINEAFRGWHTLKGLSSTFGAESLATLAHEEENLLDEVRMGRVELTPETLDALLERVETAIRALAAIDATGDVAAAAEELREKSPQKKATKSRPAPGTAPQGEPDAARLDLREVMATEILEVLTEFEEHRLRLNLQQGRGLYRIRASFSLQTIDTELDAVKRRLKPMGEIITYLPSTEGGDLDKLDIDVIFALHDSLDNLDGALAGLEHQREQLVSAQAQHRITFDGVSSARRATPTSAPAPAPSPAAESRAPSLPALAGPRENALARGRDKEAGGSLRSVSQSVRVDIGKLDRLMNAVGELDIIRVAITKVSDELRAAVGRRDLAIELHRVTRSFERRLAEMREGILEVRMVPVGQMFDRLTRMTRKLSRNIGKEIHLIISGSIPRWTS